MTLTSILSQRRPAAILAATGIASLAVFLARPAVAHAAGIEDETAFVFNTFSFLVWGALVMWMCAGIHHARVRLRAHQERLDDLPEEHRPLLDRRPCLLLHRLQPDVRWSQQGSRYPGHRLRQPDRLVQYPLRTLRRRDRSAGRRGWRPDQGAPGRSRLLGDVGLVLPDGLRGDRGLHSVRHLGREGEDVVVLLYSHSC